MAAAHPDLLKVEFDPNLSIELMHPYRARWQSFLVGAVVMNRCMLGLFGMGMLDAACSGEFSLLHPDQMLAAAKRWTVELVFPHRQELQWRCDELRDITELRPHGGHPRLNI